LFTPFKYVRVDFSFHPQSPPVWTILYWPFDVYGDGVTVLDTIFLFKKNVNEAIASFTIDPLQCPIYHIFFCLKSTRTGNRWLMPPKRILSKSVNQIIISKIRYSMQAAITIFKVILKHFQIIYSSTETQFENDI